MRTLFFVVFVSTLAQAQEASRGERRESAMPLAIGGGFFRKAPKLNTFVRGWQMTGTRPDAYEIRCDEVFFAECEVPILRTRAFKSEPLGMGSLTHSESAEPWRGRRVQVKAELRAGSIDGWAGVWMRVDGKDEQVLSFDNMQDRALRGTTAFQWHTVILNIPMEAERISFGILLHGPGAVFIREIVFSEVMPSVPVTDLMGPLQKSAVVGSNEERP